MAEGGVDETPGPPAEGASPDKIRSKLKRSQQDSRRGSFSSHLDASASFILFGCATFLKKRTFIDNSDEVN